ncbi:hypothetical protein [Acetobacter pasteurianus]|uniref:hypothetical protein n=1 Tax=Acetobacter pasteurianus TaxID=438 RepID=UPI001627F925|nr:hypothetical protein [Acetobacter pasteurianus]
MICVWLTEHLYISLHAFNGLAACRHSPDSATMASGKNAASIHLQAIQSQPWRLKAAIHFGSITRKPSATNKKFPHSM